MRLNYVVLLAIAALLATCSVDATDPTSEFPAVISSFAADHGSVLAKRLLRTHYKAAEDDEER